MPSIALAAVAVGFLKRERNASAMRIRDQYLPARHGRKGVMGRVTPLLPHILLEQIATTLTMAATLLGGGAAPAGDEHGALTAQECVAVHPSPRMNDRCASVSK